MDNSRGVNDEELQNQLRKMSKALIFKKVIVVIGFILSIFLSFSSIAVGVGGAIGSAILAFICVSDKNKIKLLASENITKSLLSEAFELCEYNPNGKISTDIIRNAGLVNDWDDASGNDYFKGKYKGCNIEFSDIHLQRLVRSIDNDEESKEKKVTVFKGPWIILEHSRELASQVRVSEGRNKKNGIETENIDFNSRFQIMSSDEQSAFLILTPQFMEFIMSADLKAAGDIFMSFETNKICVAIHNNKDFFEAKSSQYKDIEKLRNNQRNELKYLTDIMDELIKNDYLFKNNN